MGAWAREGERNPAPIARALPSLNLPSHPSPRAQDPAALHVWPLLPADGEGGEGTLPARLGPGARVALSGRALPACAGRAGSGGPLSAFLYAATDDGAAHRLRLELRDGADLAVRVDSVRLGSAGARAGPPAALCLVEQASHSTSSSPLLCVGGAAGGVVALPDAAFGHSSAYEGGSSPHLLPGEAAAGLAAAAEGEGGEEAGTPPPGGAGPPAGWPWWAGRAERGACGIAGANDELGAVRAQSLPRAPAGPAAAAEGASPMPHPPAFYAKVAGLCFVVRRGNAGRGGRCAAPAARAAAPHACCALTPM